VKLYGSSANRSYLEGVRFRSQSYPVAAERAYVPAKRALIARFNTEGLSFEPWWRKGLKRTTGDMQSLNQSSLPRVSSGFHYGKGITMGFLPVQIGDCMERIFHPASLFSALESKRLNRTTKGMQHPYRKDYLERALDPRMIIIPPCGFLSVIIGDSVPIYLPRRFGLSPRMI
jgi:hypothetical protein